MLTPYLSRGLPVDTSPKAEDYSQRFWVFILSIKLMTLISIEIALPSAAISPTIASTTS